MIQFVLIAVVSADGFIARHADDVPAAWASAEEQAVFAASMAEISWSFMGRNTHRNALKAERRRVIFSRRVDAPRWEGERWLWVNPARTGLKEMIALTGATGRCAVLGGTGVYDWFLEHARYDTVDLSIEPIRFEGGLQLFSRVAWHELERRLAESGLEPGEDRILNAGGTRHRTWRRARPLIG
ncbi:MAG: hypothetical protein FJX46_03855 [Alphaproteobacteria bacterium]|nr:hypothetical protein [Alphaproteobacteria bacterium]